MKHHERRLTVISVVLLVIGLIVVIVPYLWIVLAGTGEGFPAIVFWVVGLLVLCLGANAVYSVAKRVHRAREAEERPPVVVGRDSVPTT